jgi:hypothetical protein
MTAPGTQGEVSSESMGKTASSAVGRETGLSPHYWEPCGTKPTKTLPRKAVRSMERVEVRKSKKEIPVQRRFWAQPLRRHGGPKRDWRGDVLFALER